MAWDPEPPYRFLREIRGGSSMPLIVLDARGREYLVKMKGAGGGVAALICEWVALGLGRKLSIPVPVPVLLRGEDIHWEPPIDPEISELIERSRGANIAFPYHARAEPADLSGAAWEIGGAERETLDRIFLFDLFLLNIDRTPANPNLLVFDGSLQALDFDAALKLRACLDGREPVVGPEVLREIRRNPLYRPGIDVRAFQDDLGRLKPGDMAEILDPMPGSWLPEYCGKPMGEQDDTAARMVERMLNYAARSNEMESNLNRLEAMAAETDAERGARLDENRRRFLNTGNRHE